MRLAAVAGMPLTAAALDRFEAWALTAGLHSICPENFTADDVDLSMANVSAHARPDPQGVSVERGEEFS